MTKDNQAKFERACEALKLMGLTPTEFIDLDMAMCIKAWEDDLGPLDMTPAEVMDMHADYYVDLCERALKL